MSFVTGTQMECIYAMPFKATAMTAASTTVMSATSAQGPCILPQNFFMQQSGGGVGKTLWLKGGGVYSVGGTADTITYTFGLDSTQGTLGTTIAATGAITPQAATSNGLFTFDVFVTLTTEAGSASVAIAVGTLNISAISSAGAMTATVGTFGTTNACNTVHVGNPASTITSFATNQTYFVEMFGAWSATTSAPSTQLTNFYIFGIN